MRRATIAVAVAVVGLAVTGVALGLPPMADQRSSPAEQPPVDDGTPTPTPEPTPTPVENGTVVVPTDGTVPLETRANETIHGATSLPEGTTLTIRLESTDSSQPFLRQITATVGANGTFVAPVDLTAIDQNSTATLTVHHGEETLTTRTARIERVPGTAPEAESRPHLVYEGDRLTVENESGQTIRGETDLSAGTDLVVRVRSTNGGSPFLYQQPATVRDDGTFEATFNFSAVQPGTEFEVVVRNDERTFVDTSGVVE
ncbi:MAG: BGTF surface domain-containing protein [Haloarculaceae archaeon]